MNNLLYTVSWYANGIRNAQSFHSYSESSEFVLELLENNSIEIMMCKIYSTTIDDETDDELESVQV